MERPLSNKEKKICMQCFCEESSWYPFVTINWLPAPRKGKSEKRGLQRLPKGGLS